MYMSHLGVYLKNENKLDEMVDILHELHRLVPAKSETQMYLYLIAMKFGHCLRSLSIVCCSVVIRTRAGVRIRNNSTSSADRLEGLLPNAEDWHAKVVFPEVSTVTFMTLFEHSHKY